MRTLKNRSCADGEVFLTRQATVVWLVLALLNPVFGTAYWAGRHSVPAALLDVVYRSLFIWKFLEKIVGRDGNVAHGRNSQVAMLECYDNGTR
jgi:hypothetical protein